MKGKSAHATYVRCFQIHMADTRLNFAHLCDTAFLSKDGKLNIIGIFENIMVAQLPARHPRMTLVMNLHLTKGSHPFKVRMVKDDGNKTVTQVEGNIEYKSEEGNAGLINEFVDVTIDAAGKYSLEIWVDNEPVGENGKLTFTVAERQNKQ